jgi:hypothetical protein
MLNSPTAQLSYLSSLRAGWKTPPDPLAGCSSPSYLALSASHPLAAAADLSSFSSQHPLGLALCLSSLSPWGIEGTSKGPDHSRIVEYGTEACQFPRAVDMRACQLFRGSETLAFSLPILSPSYPAGNPEPELMASDLEV